MEVFISIGLALIAAVLALASNYWLQQRLHRRYQAADELKKQLHRRYQAADELKKQLYEFLRLVADYWISGAASGTSLRGLEAKIAATQFIIESEYELVEKQSEKLKNWYLDTEQKRTELMAAVTGRGFPSTGDNWEPKPERVGLAAGAIVHIVNKLYDNC